MLSDSTRVRGAILTREPRARVTSVDSIAEVLQVLEFFGPEPEGVVVEIDWEAVDEFPDGWRWRPLAAAWNGTVPNAEQEEALLEIVEESGVIEPRDLYDRYQHRMSEPESDDSVRRYLRILSDRGKLEAVGENRGRRYRWPGEGAGGSSEDG